MGVSDLSSGSLHAASHPRQKEYSIREEADLVARGVTYERRHIGTQGQEPFDQMAPEDLMGNNIAPKDDLYAQVYSIVTHANTASTTFLQRKLKIGYARAARQRS